MTLDHDIVRAIIKNFPDISQKYDSLPELSRDVETLRECHAFFMKLARYDTGLQEDVNLLMYHWRNDLLDQMEEMMRIRRQKTLDTGEPLI